MICSNCGKQNPDGSQFCTGCGLYFTDSSSNQDYNYMDPPEPQQPQYHQYQYQQQQPHQYANMEPVSVGKWVGIWAINLIPCVGPIVFLVLMFVWAFGNTAPLSLKNYAKAQLIIIAIAIGIFLLLYVFVFLSISSSVPSYYYRSLY